MYWWYTAQVMFAGVERCLPCAVFGLAVLGWFIWITLQAGTGRVDAEGRAVLAGYIAGGFVSLDLLMLWGKAEQNLIFHLAYYLHVFSVPAFALGALYALGTGIGGVCRLGWKAWSGFGLYTVLLGTLAGYYLADFPTLRPFTESGMARYFERHKPEFEALAIMVQEDDLVAVTPPPYFAGGLEQPRDIYSDWLGTWHFRRNSDTAEPLSNDRKRAHVELLRRVDLRDGLRVDDNGAIVFFFYYLSWGALTEADSMIYVFSSDSDPCDKSRICRRIDTDWYVVTL